MVLLEAGRGHFFQHVFHALPPPSTLTTLMAKNLVQTVSVNLEWDQDNDILVTLTELSPTNRSMMYLELTTDHNHVLVIFPTPSNLFEPVLHFPFTKKMQQRFWSPANLDSGSGFQISACFVCEGHTDFMWKIKCLPHTQAIPVPKDFPMVQCDDLPMDEMICDKVHAFFAANRDFPLNQFVPRFLTWIQSWSDPTVQVHDFSASDLQVIQKFLMQTLARCHPTKVYASEFTFLVKQFGPLPRCWQKLSALFVPGQGPRPCGLRVWCQDSGDWLWEQLASGSFLIRPSQRQAGSWAAEYNDPDSGGVHKTSRILNTPAGYHFDDRTDLFDTLHHLVKDFRHIFITPVQHHTSLLLHTSDRSSGHIAVSDLLKYPRSLLGSWFDPQNKDAIHADFSLHQDTFLPFPVLQRKPWIIKAIIQFYSTNQPGATAASLSISHETLEQMLQFLQITPEQWQKRQV